MYELFYIIETQGGWYQLCIKGTHYVLSSGSDLDKVLMTLKGLVKKYRTKERLMKALSKTEDKGQVSEKTMTVYNDWCEELSHHYDHLVKRTVKEGLEESKQYTTFNKVRKKLKVIAHGDTRTVKGHGEVITDVSRGSQEEAKWSLRGIHEESMRKPRGCQEESTRLTVKRPMVIKRKKCLTV